MLSSQQFDAVTQLFFDVSGIRLGEHKRPLVVSRLQKLAQEKGCSSLDEYVDTLLRQADPMEMVKVVDKLTTNETYFFREPQHFDCLARLVAQRKPGAAEFRVWSAASSSGEEAYSIAMLLADKLGLKGWEVLGTDLSTQMVESARRALYTQERARNVPQSYLKQWCLKGQGAYAGSLLIDKSLRSRVRFIGANLTQTLPEIGYFDVIFLRNVLIYFDNPGKEDIVNRVLTRLKPQGFLFTGHAESLANLNVPLKAVAPAVYSLR
ncbi:MAG: methyltransferase domain-containing protein [Burkholderiales bacterium]|nr:methyltransferase domain-containing protein [Burkholderiales bacterium]